jgi:hypothetical protein
MSSNIEVKLDVLNQKASPALYAAPLANRPAASFTGRLFVDSDSPSTGIYRDTGSTWIQVADQGAGTTGTLQQVTTNGNTSNTGISITANGIGIGTTIPATNRLDIHAASGIQATFNGTGTTNAGLQLQSAGVGKWTIQNNYNSAANDFVLTDVLNSVNRLVIKNTGLATYTGFFNVANIASAQNIQISGTAPAYTIVEGTGNANTASIGVASIANNFIQGSVEGDFCIVSQSTVAKRLLLGVQSANSSAICISASNNVLINSIVDSGYKLFVNGTANFTNTIQLNDQNACYLYQSGNTTDTKYWAIQNLFSTGDFRIRALNDALTNGLNGLVLQRAGISSIVANFDGGDVKINAGSLFVAFRLNVNGATDDGSTALNVTGAGKFSALITVNLTTAGSAINLVNTSTNNIFTTYSNASNNTYIGLIGNNGVVQTNNDFEVYTGASYTKNLTIASTGAATFSSSIAIGNTVTAAVAVASTHKVSILIGGVQYYLLASNI